MSFLDRIRECHNHDPAGFRPWIVAGEIVGHLRDGIAARLTSFPSVFSVETDRILLAPELSDYVARSEAVAEVAAALAEDGAISGLRGELYPVGTGFSVPPLLQLDRAAVPAFGVRAYGVHLSGYVREGDALKMWIGRRSPNKRTYPGLLDNMVAGGQPIGIGLMDNLVKECAEEAAIPEALARKAVPVGAITYVHEAPEGLKPDVQFCFELELPADFVPRNTDGEITEFYLWPIEQVAETVRDTNEFKFNCNLVIIDFLVRHGLIAPEHPDYVAIARGLRS